MRLARRVLPLTLALLSLAACGDGEGTLAAGSDRPTAGDSPGVEGPPSLATPPYAPGAVVGKAYEDYWLTTHCGVKVALIDGFYWHKINGSPTPGGGSIPDAWGSPYQKGTLRMTSEDRAVFSALGASIEFVRTSETDYATSYPCA